MKNELEATFDRMLANWPSEFVSRQSVGVFTGGMVSPKTLANFDSLGVGPLKIKIGRNAGYPKLQFVEWLRSRTKGPHEPTGEDRRDLESAFVKISERLKNGERLEAQQEGGE